MWKVDGEGRNPFLVREGFLREEMVGKALSREELSQSLLSEGRFSQ